MTQSSGRKSVARMGSRILGCFFAKELPSMRPLRYAVKERSDHMTSRYDFAPIFTKDRLWTSRLKLGKIDMVVC